MGLNGGHILRANFDHCSCPGQSKEQRTSEWEPPPELLEIFLLSTGNGSHIRTFIERSMVPKPSFLPILVMVLLSSTSPAGASTADCSVIRSIGPVSRQSSLDRLSLWGSGSWHPILRSKTMAPQTYSTWSPYDCPVRRQLLVTRDMGLASKRVLPAHAF